MVAQNKDISNSRKDATMASQDDRSLLDTLREVSNLPEYMRADALKNVVAVWRRRSSLVEDVVSGNTTFENVVSALVEENGRLRFFGKGICNSPHFEEIAKETEQRIAGVLPLTSWSFKPRSMTLLDLREPVSFVNQLLWCMKFNFGTGLGTSFVLWALVSYFVEPKVVAYWHWALGYGAGFATFITTLQVLFGYPGYLAERRGLAQRTMRDAKYLDSMLKPQRA